MLITALKSFLNQTIDDFEIVISDNSTNNQTQNLLKKIQNQRFVYIKRGNLTSNKHFQQVYRESIDSSCKYFIFFHDDDFVEKNYVETMLMHIKTSNTGAVGCNGYFIKNNKRTKKIMRIKKNIKFASSENFLEYYMSIKETDISPYPSYIFNKEAVKTFFGVSIGKYSDVAQLATIVQRHNLMWISSPLVNYRIHDKQDSFTECISDRIRLISFLINRKLLDSNNPILKDYKFRYLLKKIRTSKLTPKKRKVIFKYLVANSIVFIRRNIYGFLANKYLS